MRERLTTAADFPGLAVFRETGPAGSIYTVEFWNKEQPGWFFVGLCILLGWACIIFAFYYTYVEALVVAGILFIFAVIAAQPRPFWRVIELDFSRNELRVKRSGRVKVRKPMPRFKFDMALERHHGIYSRDQGLRYSGERQHCLVGYFGLMSTDRTVLLCRYEWPPQHSLMEVQGAVMLVWQFGQEERRRLTGGEGPHQLPGGIAPPLE